MKIAPQRNSGASLRGHFLLEKGVTYLIAEVASLVILELLGFNPLCSQTGWCPQPVMHITACWGFSSAPARKSLVKKDIRKHNDVQTSSRYLVSNSSLIYQVVGLDGTNMELERQECLRRQILQKVEDLPCCHMAMWRSGRCQADLPQTVP